MTHVEMQKRREEAIRFYGPEGFAQLIRVSTKYMEDNNIPIPQGGVTFMPSFWLTVDELIRFHST